jgi:hypothetical protein
VCGFVANVSALDMDRTYFEGGIWQKIEQNMPDLFKTALVN